MYITGQIIGIVVTVVCILSAQLKKKWQMLIVSLTANALQSLAYLLIEGGFTSAMVLCFVAVLQCFVTLVHVLHEKKPPLYEKIVFLILFPAAGLLTYTTPLDLFSIAGAVFFMLGTFQREPQHVRMFGVANCLTWMVYNAITLNTAIFTQIFSLFSTRIALYRYRGTREVTTA